MASLFQSIAAVFGGGGGSSNARSARRDQAMSSTRDAFSLPSSQSEYRNDGEASSSSYTYPPAPHGGTYDSVPQTSYELRQSTTSPTSSTFFGTGRRSSQAILPTHRGDTANGVPYPSPTRTWQRIRTWLANEYPELDDTLNYGIDPHPASTNDPGDPSHSAQSITLYLEMTALTPAFVLIALVVSAAAGPVPGRQAPFAVAKRDHSAGPVVAAKVLSNDRPKASLPDVGVNPNPAPRLSSRLFGRNTKYVYDPDTGDIEMEETTPSLLSLSLGHHDGDDEGALIDLDLLRRQTTGDIISSGAAEGDVPHEAHMMRSRAFRATVNKKLAKAKSGAKNTATQKMKTVASTPGQVKAVMAAQQPAVTPSTDSTTTTIVPVDTDRESLVNLDLDLGHAREAAVYSQAVAAAPAPVSAAVAPPVASAASTAGSATANSGNSALVFDPNQISSTKFAKSGAAKVHAVTGQDASSVTDAAVPAATTLYTATHDGLLDVALGVL